MLTQTVALSKPDVTRQLLPPEINCRQSAVNMRTRIRGCHLCSGSSIHGGVASIKRPNSGSSALIFCFTSHAILR